MSPRWASAAAAVAAAVALVGGAVALATRTTAPTLVDDNAAAAISAAAPGARLRLAAGDHPGPLVINRPITLTAEQGARIVSQGNDPAVVVSGTHDVRLEDLHVVGGSSGIEIRHSDDVTVARAVIRGSELHGIFVHDAEVSVVDCRMAALRSDLAQGFEIINSDTRDPSRVEGCTVEGPVFEGIASHVSHVTFTDNLVTGSTERGIVITEMSMGAATKNEVRDATGRAYHCGDMSHCTFLDNVAAGVADAKAGWRSSAGHGLVVHFHSTATVKRLRTSGLDGEPVLLMLDSHLRRHPSSGLPPMAPLAGVGAVYFALFGLARLAGLRGIAGVLLPTLALQAGHQLEHAVQVGQMLLGHAATHGLAGAVVDNEWMHLAFNAALLAGMVGAARQRVGGLARTSGASFDPVAGPAGMPALLGITLAVQAYHVVEHLTRVGQYLVTGISPAPGLAGMVVGTGNGLIWFHFAINALVTLLLVFTALAARPWRRAPTTVGHPRLAPALSG